MQSKDDLNNKIVFLIPYRRWDSMVKKSESRYCPFKAAMMKGEGGAEMVVRQEEVGVGGGHHKRKYCMYHLKIIFGLE